MKKKIALLFITTTLLLGACQHSMKGKNGVIYTSALQYNDYIYNKQKELMDQANQFSQASQNSNLAKADAILDTAVATAKRYITDVEGMPAWKEDSAFRDAAVNSFRFYLQMFGEDYRYIIAMQRDGNISAEEEAKYNQLRGVIRRTEAQLDSQLIQSQQSFGKKNGIKIH